MFFKEGQKEEMLCHGAYVIERLIKNERLNREKLRSQRSTQDSNLWITYNDKLRMYVCPNCSFCADGCDFYAEGLVEDIEPCGGFILLSYLKENNVINDSDLQIAAHE